MKKISKAKLAKTYALALYEAAAERKSVEKIWNDVLKLQTFLKDDVSFSSYLSSPLWEEKDKEDVLKKTAQVLKLDEETLQCLQIVSENHRIVELPLILEYFKQIYYQKSNVAEVVVETIQPLSAVQNKKLSALLEKFFAKKVVIDYQINPSILGGLRLKCESEMIDDSLSAKLNYLENLMKGK